MPRRRYHIAAPLFAALLSACGALSEPDPGVSFDMAIRRAQQISDVEYLVDFEIPSDRRSSIQGRQQIRFEYRPPRWGDDYLVIDFKPGGESVNDLQVNGRSITVRSANGHLLVNADRLSPGANEITIAFQADDGPFNRREDYLYTLFVPARASEAFPCFDQPDLKATFELRLELPEDWTAVSNGRLTAERAAEVRRHFAFAPTLPVSTYLFAFAAGRFKVEESVLDGRRLRFWHRESDLEKVSRNRQALFDLHAGALAWMEEYTQIPFPFPKFDFVLLPGFQFGGMEHPGAVFYRAERLLLDEAPTQNEVVDRASLIAHETAHMWFGDLVTMAWFDDVWTKEVFANFMAAKATHPRFPEIDHDLRFFLSHYPSAYAVDRSAGTHPIRQELDNLSNASTLYGAVIYDKAPAVMRQLELLIGPDSMREGLQAYLQQFAFRNARWADLIGILDSRTDLDLHHWSRIWVESAGRPRIQLSREEAADGRQFVRLVQHDPADQGRLWPQPLRPLIWSSRGARRLQLTISDRETTLGWIIGIPSVVLPNAGGIGYGLFLLPDEDLRLLLRQLPQLPTPLDRAAAVEILWDALMEGRLDPADLLASLLTQLASEREDLILGRLLSLLTTSYWGFLTPEERLSRASEVEKLLWERLLSAPSDSQRLLFFRGLRTVALSPEGVGKIRAIWDGASVPRGLKLSPADQMETALELSVRRPDAADTLLDEQLQRLEQDFLREQFRFVSKAASPDPERRERFFQRLREPGQRQIEPWVLQAVRLLHHPLRAREAEQFILPSLELLEELQRTGDIFFPKRWLDATLEGHQTPTAARTVESFLDSRPDYPRPLRAKIMQAADLLFRKAAIVGTSPGSRP